MLIIKLLKNHEKGLYRTYHYFYPRQSNQTTNLNNKNPIIFDRKIAKKSWERSTLNLSLKQTI